MKRKPLKKDGVTLIELLIAISLMGFIFALGIHPMLSQSRMIGAEREEITLFDEANLASFYITRDAAMAEDCDLISQPGIPSPSVTFTINAASLDPTGATPPTPRTLHTVTYTIASVLPFTRQLRRIHRDENGTVQSNISVTEKMNWTMPAGTAPASFIIDPDYNPAQPQNVQNHRLRCQALFQGQPTQNLFTIFTQRDFDVKLRCKDARR